MSERAIALVATGLREHLFRLELQIFLLTSLALIFCEEFLFSRAVRPLADRAQGAVDSGRDFLLDKEQGSPIYPPFTSSLFSITSLLQ